MGIRKTLEKLAITGRQYFGSSENISQRYDSGAGQYVQRDEANATDQVQIADGNDLLTELEAGGLMELVISNLLNFDPTAVLVDTRANQPAAGTADRIMVVTDAAGGPVIERDTGAAWETIAASDGALKENGEVELFVEDLGTSETSTAGLTIKTDGSGGLNLGASSAPVITDTEQYLASLGG